MGFFKRAGLLAAATLLAACSRTVIDDAKDASLPECPGETLGTIVNDYFITGLDSKTLWSAYATDDPDTLRVTAEGQVLYIGVSTKATLEVMYNTARDELSLSGLKFNGEAQPRTFATALVSNMCDKAKGLN